MGEVHRKSSSKIMRKFLSIFRKKIGLFLVLSGLKIWAERTKQSFVKVIKDKSPNYCLVCKHPINMIYHPYCRRTLSKNNIKRFYQA